MVLLESLLSFTMKHVSAHYYIIVTDFLVFIEEVDGGHTSVITIMILEHVNWENLSF